MTVTSSSLSRMRGGSRNGTDAASSSTPSVPVHTSEAASCMLFFKRLRELQQQLLERDRTGHARAERLQRFVRRLALAVDAAVGRVREPALHRAVQQGGDHRGDDREPEHPPFGLVGRVAEAEHDDEVDRADHDDDAAGLDRAHEQAVDAHRERLDRRHRDRERHEQRGADRELGRDARPVEQRLEQADRQREAAGHDDTPAHPLQPAAVHRARPPARAHVREHRAEPEHDRLADHRARARVGVRRDDRGTDRDNRADRDEPPKLAWQPAFGQRNRESERDERHEGCGRGRDDRDRAGQRDPRGSTPTRVRSDVASRRTPRPRPTRRRRPRPTPLRRCCRPRRRSRDRSRSPRRPGRRRTREPSRGLAGSIAMPVVLITRSSVCRPDGGARRARAGTSDATTAIRTASGTVSTSAASGSRGTARTPMLPATSAHT